MYLQLFFFFFAISDAFAPVVVDVLIFAVDAADVFGLIFDVVVVVGISVVSVAVIGIVFV
jgi:hypothetical protein